MSAPSHKQIILCLDGTSNDEFPSLFIAMKLRRLLRLCTVRRQEHERCEDHGHAQEGLALAAACLLSAWRRMLLFCCLHATVTD